MESFNFNFIQNKSLLFNFVIIFSFWLIYLLVIRATTNFKMDVDHKRRFIAKTRGLFILLALLSSIIIWASEIYSVILSITAVAAAMTIATKELLLCIAGTFYRASTRAFNIGDRIEVNGVRGDIIDIGIMATEVLEVGPLNLTHQYTGRSVTIPNSIFLSHNITNESYSTDFVLHVFEVPVAFDKFWEKHQESLLKAANEVCDVYVDKARLHFQKIARKLHMESPVIEPRVTLKVKSPTEVILIVRVTVPGRMKGTLEQDILKRYLTTVSSKKFVESR